ncbi:hypothetical protein PSE10A_53500 [Pseudomonas amygdali pv. eriobotryae]|uniref:Uncharacterized protein n=1 Tax=Pseudomonas amygdali pv. eriobotryae TaxID=129137 RepID=A0A9P3EF92_PSEA0|nr:hypothetical protein PSE10A_53500 [Pseudomonas amygdali pv. eriobotryae]
MDTIASSDGVRKVCCPDGYVLVSLSLIKGPVDADIVFVGRGAQVGLTYGLT